MAGPRPAAQGVWLPAALIAVTGAVALSDEPYVDGYLRATALFSVPSVLLSTAVEFGKGMAVRRVT